MRTPHVAQRMILGIAMLALASGFCTVAQAASPAGIKVLLCTGDYGMWAQDRVPLITEAVTKAAPGKVSFESDQSFNFVKKLEAQGYAERFDVIACGDVGLGEMTTRAQQAIVQFVNKGGGFIYVVWGKSTLGFDGPPQAEPMPLASILPYEFPTPDPTKHARPGTTVLSTSAPFFKGLDFSTTVIGKAVASPVLAMERQQGKGRVIALFGAFGATYKYVSYAKFEPTPGGWDQWPQLGGLWDRLINQAAAASPNLGKTFEQVDASIHNVPLDVTAEVDATRDIDDIRAGDFSVVSLSQLYNEDGGAGANLFLDLNPEGWFDRLSQKVLTPQAEPGHDLDALFRKYGIQGIIMADDSFGSYGGWNAEKFNSEVDAAVQSATMHPQALRYFQPGNEPPCDDGYFKFHNRIAAAVLAKAPELKVLGPNTAFNLLGPNEKQMKAFVDKCGAYTDVLCWHTYAVCPESTRAEVLYWTKYAAGKLRSKGPVHVIFTESDIWNTEQSQFNYLMDRAFTFLPMKQILANFQYCMRPRTEGGAYRFGVLQPEGEFEANYNGYWAWRNLRGKMVGVQLAGAGAAALAHCHVLASSDQEGKVVTVVVYYDTGYSDGDQESKSANMELRVKLPAGQYQGQRSDVSWNSRKVTDLPVVAQGTATASVTLGPCQAAAFTWVRK